MAIEYINAQPWEQQHSFNDLQSGDITGWAYGTSLPVTAYTATSAITKNRAFILSGIVAGASASTRCFSAPISDEGIIGTWAEITGVPAGANFASAVIVRDKLYFFGGDSAVADINSDGTLGTWTAGPSMGYECRAANVVITKNKIYLIGGYKSGVTTAEVRIADISSDGVVGTFSYHNSMPAAKQSACLFSVGTKVYVAGGSNAGGNQKTIFVSDIDDDGIIGAWGTADPLPQERYWACSATVGGMVYFFGGIYSPGTGTATVYRSSIDSNDNLSAWTSGTTLPATNHSSSLLITSSRVYIIGGSVTATSMYASFAGGLNDYVNTSWWEPLFWTNFHAQTEVLE